MQRRCDQCGKPYEAKRATSKYCSSTCRAARSKAPESAVVSPIQPDPGSSGLVEATRRKLDGVERLDTVLGQQALALAGRIASPHESGSSVASLSKEFRAVMDAAMEGVAVAADPLDELRARRDRKRAAG